MITPAAGVRIWLAAGLTDMRRGFVLSRNLTDRRASLERLGNAPQHQRQGRHALEFQF
jgi:hypothetical protein